jgi:hypothetical protein
MYSSIEAPLLLRRKDDHKEEQDEKRRWWREAVEESGRLVALAVPMIAVALLQLMMQLISTVMVGHLGEVALAGAAMANSITIVSGFSLIVSLLTSPNNPFYVFLFSDFKVLLEREMLFRSDVRKQKNTSDYIGFSIAFAYHRLN